MVKTRKEKEDFVKEQSDIITTKKTIIFTDFAGTTVNDLNALRKELDEVGARFQVVKKRLLRVMFDEKKFEFDPETLEGQLGIIIADEDMEEIAGPVYKFAAASDTFKILGGFETEDKKFLEKDMVEMIGKLPGREVLLSQLVGIIAGPLRAFLYILSEKSKQTS